MKTFNEADYSFQECKLYNIDWPSAEKFLAFLEIQFIITTMMWQPQYWYILQGPIH